MEEDRGFLKYAVEFRHVHLACYNEGDSEAWIVAEEVIPRNSKLAGRSIGLVSVQ